MIGLLLETFRNEGTPKWVLALIGGAVGAVVAIACEVLS